MEHINLGQDFTAIVDFAHTPNALKEALQTARQLTALKLIVVFGSAGLRDREKRRMMAEVSINNADISIFTAEDPRTESLTAILSEMADETRQHGGVVNKNYYIIEDRGEAIRKALSMANKGDIVMVCGKGHEQSMCFGETEFPWDDRIALRAALSEKLKIQGPPMPWLPTQEKKKPVN
jgi:UDP-N-acetylmuramoyl-L-alanyl-D-glutamate--2,6-diaminopimelate ligase